MAGSAAFAAVLYVLRQVAYEGGDGLVYASCAAMVCRIRYAYVHARGKQGDKVGWGRLMPDKSSALAMAVAGGVLRGMKRREVDEGGWRGRVVMIGVGGVLGILCVAVMGLKEWKRWKSIQV